MQFVHRHASACECVLAFYTYSFAAISPRRKIKRKIMIIILYYRNDLSPPLFVAHDETYAAKELERKSLRAATAAVERPTVAARDYCYCNIYNEQDV